MGSHDCLESPPERQMGIQGRPMPVVHVNEKIMADRIRELEAKVERLTNRVVEQECELDRKRDLEAVEKAAYELLLCNTGHRDGCGCDFCGFLLILSKTVEAYHKTINAV